MSFQRENLFEMVPSTRINVYLSFMSITSHHYIFHKDISLLSVSSWILHERPESWPFVIKLYTVECRRYTVISVKGYFLGWAVWPNVIRLVFASCQLWNGLFRGKWTKLVGFLFLGKVGGVIVVKLKEKSGFRFKKRNITSP